MGRRCGTFGVFVWAKQKASVARHKLPLCPSYHRTLRFEPLEERRVLATFTVDTLSDTVDAGDGVTSLREAVAAANMAAGADTIEFAASLVDGGPATILLTQDEIAITEALTIDARPLVQNVTIDANSLSRVFNITAATGDFTLAGLTLINGKTTGNNASTTDSTFSGGAVRCASSGLLTLDRCTVLGSRTTGRLARGGGVFTSGELSVTHTTVSENSTTGFNSNGGGVFSRGHNVTLVESVVSGNFTTNTYSDGGGISASVEGGLVTIERSIISDNSTAGIEAWGGGMYVGNLIATDCTISGNSTAGSNAYGGGVHVFGNLELTRSTVSGNQTLGDRAHGGGIHGYSRLTLNQSTISGNVANGRDTKGGGICFFGRTALYQSTITENRATGINSAGGGIWLSSALSITGSIFSNNEAFDGVDLVSTFASVVADYSVIGTGVVPTGGGNNISTDDPQLGPLADNGGLTWTPALLPGSPALDAGDPGAVAGENGVPLYDQRGNPFGRVFDGDGVGGARIDIGAFESQPILPTVIGDYNADGVNDAADYVVWRKAVRSMVTPFTGADGDGDGVIGQGDYGVWRSHFGAGGAGLGAGASGELGVGSGAQGGVGSGEGDESRVEGRESSAGALVQASSLDSNDMAIDALGAMPVSERLAHVAASFQDADGGVQAGATATAFVELSYGAHGALAGPVAPQDRVVAWGGEQCVFSRSTAGQANSGTQRIAATADAALVAWLNSRGRERTWDDEGSLSSLCVDGGTESSLVPECWDAVFTRLGRTLP